ncbi:MORC family CW-type zinc finger protein 3-like [Camellia sinensis]|uniref:MORC family CW-type zinc finger protein 3-like n=1 Tax=Camellia sinensis TaxID=4442 RepID=UPI001035F328|nr:MORC family CW-type zinc finger protein 3-like [Camellia sinensis]XP_028065680.1 MORC family CW-type zinc finger protein 3-like [Camellia sinensis]
MVEAISKCEQPNEGNFATGFECYILLKKDGKTICRTRCLNPLIQMPPVWTISDIVRQKPDGIVSGLPQCILLPAFENSQQQNEWGLFLGFLRKYKRVAITKIGAYEFYISPPNEGSNFSHAVVSRRMGKLHNMCDGQKHGISETTEDPYDRESRDGTCSRAETSVPRQNDPLEKNFVQAHPSYLKTLGQAHSGWIFGAIAELVDNSRDAKATKFEVSIGMVYSKIAGKGIPMLSVIDDGHGMTHQQILRMISFGHEQPDADDPDHIGRFGIGFKTGAMRLGKDALVLTQTANSRSIAFLSQSLNEGKDNLEIPIVSYCRRGQFMEVDTSVQTEALAKHNLKAIKEFSPFNKYLIGEKASLFQEKRTGTQIYIWNLDKWGSDYCLEWQTGRSGGSSFHQGDILIRSQRIRSRPGQTSRRVPLDYSLRAYLEVIFLDPRMKLYVQGSLVRSLPLAKCLNRTVVENGNIMGKHVQIILGRCQLEWEQANCGIFLYWHGRLIEAYKRVGGMIHSADTGRGVIGVLDVTDLMNDGNGQVWVHSNKQGFQDCELYARLEEWLGSRFDQYWDNNYDALQLEKGGAFYKPDHEWVQCDKCRKWRMLRSGFDSRKLPQEWFCYMDPFNGKCEMSEQKVERGVIIVSEKRAGYDSKRKHVVDEDALHVKPNRILQGSSDNDDDDSEQTVEDGGPHCLKRLRRGPARFCKKT